ncbi:MAG: phosphomethylpyrimidine synthase ThiC, partial [Desulfococcaceae bacterium]
MKEYDAVLSLGNGIRAGAIHDGHDRAQMAEMIANCELAELGREMGCQTMAEGPGHVPLDEIAANILLEKRMGGGAPHYVPGPLPADCGAGCGQVAAAIGAASSVGHGADLVCCIAPAGHLAPPSEADVREGVRATRLAVHVGDLAKYPERRDRGRAVSPARRDTRWEDQMSGLLFPDKAREIRGRQTPDNER